MKISLKKSVVTLALGTLLSTQTFAAAKVGQLIVEGASKLESVLSGKGFTPNASARLAENAFESAEQLLMKGETVTLEKIQQSLDASMITDAADQKVAKEVLAVLNTDIDKVSIEQVRKALNDLSSLAQRYALNSSVASCKSCASDALATGNSTKKVTITDAKVQKALELVRARLKGDKRKMQFIKNTFRKHAGVKKVNVDVENLELRAVAAQLLKTGSEDQKKMITAMAKLDDVHNFDQVLTEMLTGEGEAWAKRFNRMDELEKQGLSTKEAFYKTLDQDIAAEKNPAKKADKEEAKNEIINKGCFFDKAA